nr:MULTISPECIES: hypothetical protein [unclassified Alteromonas]
MNRNVPSILIIVVLLCMSKLGQAEGTPIYFQDCSFIDFGEQDTSLMTEAEKIEAMDKSLFSVLDQTEECMNNAAQSAAQGIADAAGSGAGSGSGALGANGTGTSGESAEQSNAQSASTNSQASSTKSTSATSKTTVGGPSQGGSSAVCDAVNTGLQGATTESEKTHFKELKEQYGCK